MHLLSHFIFHQPPTTYCSISSIKRLRKPCGFFPCFCLKPLLFSPRCSPVRFKGKADIRSSLHLPSHNILSYEYILTQYLSQCTSHCSHFVIQSYNYQSTTLMIKWPFKMRQKRPFSPFCAKICILVKNVYRLVQKDCPYMDIRYA